MQASSMRAPALLECVAAIAAAPRLVPVLAGQPSGSAAQHEASSLQTSGLAPPRLGHK